LSETYPHHAEVAGETTMKNRFWRVVGEFAVVVLGVFVALAAESWWSERAERRYERELREDMRAEFEANLRILEADLAANDTAHARVTAFSQLGADQLEGMSSQDVTAAIGSWLSWSGFDPEMGTAQALVESGNVGAIADRELRLLLSRWAGLLEEKRRFNLQAVDFQMHRVAPMISHAAADREWTGPERREARDLLAALATLQSGVIENQGRLQSAARDILDYLQR
jgi:hypothetical protein